MSDIQTEVSENLKRNSSKLVSEKLTRRGKSSSASLRAGSAKETKRLSNSLRESTNDEEKLSSGASTLPEAPKTNYRDELTFIFFSSMLDTIVEQWTKLEDVCVCMCDKSLPANDSYSQGNSTMLRSQDFINTPKACKCSEGTKSSEALDVKSSTVRSSNFTLKVTSLKSNNNSIIEEEKEEESKVVETSVFDGLFKQADENILIRFRNGNTYQGPVYRMVMHGRGKFTWADGAIYEGDFVHGEATGKGTLRYPDLSTYEGGFYKSLLHGEGVLNMSNTTMHYRGSFKAGQKHGKGCFYYDSGDWFDGEWCNDERHGQGTRYYKTGERYTGMWCNGQRSGKGTLVWSNNDFYTGEWRNGLMNGYGEYTWDAFLNETFCFPIENMYKGNWIDGERDGVGILSYGTKYGAKLVGTWRRNEKHGPGIFVCDNGKIIERNPLFLKDKPIRIGSPEDRPQFLNTLENILDSRESLPATHRMTQKLSKTESKILDRNKSGNVVCGRPNFKDIPILDYPSLEVPMCLSPDEIDVSHYIKLGIDKYGIDLYENNMHKIGTISNTCTLACSKWKLPKIQLLDKNSTSEKITKAAKDDFKKFQKVQFLIEEKCLRNMITVNLHKLQQLYEKYATIATSINVALKSVMVRLFLWQMLRDFHIVDEKYSLVDLDLIFINNAAMVLETEHCPFEKIYFWQFLHVLLTLAWLLHKPCDVADVDSKAGVLSAIFKSFLTNIVEANVSITRACSLFEFRDVVPINAMYLLYRSVGEPHTVRKLFNKICVRKGEDPLCSLHTLESEPTLGKGLGRNAVAVGENLVYLPGDSPDIGEAIPQLPTNPSRQDPYRRELCTYRSLGPRNVMGCIIAVCPQVEKDGFIVNVEYKLSFIEFYEILLLCSFLNVDKLKKREEIKRICKEKKLSADVSASPSYAFKKKDKKVKTK